MFRRYAFTLLVLLGSADLARATTIVIMRTSTGFVVGADSLSVLEKDGKRQSTEQVCKLGRLGANQYVAVAGDVEVFWYTPQRVADDRKSRHQRWDTQNR